MGGETRIGHLSEIWASDESEGRLLLHVGISSTIYPIDLYIASQCVLWLSVPMHHVILRLLDSVDQRRSIFSRNL